MQVGSYKADLSNKSEEEKNISSEKETQLLDVHGFDESMKFSKLLRVCCSWTLWRGKRLL